MLESIEMNRLIICTAKPPATIEGMAVCPGKDIAVAVGFFLVEVNTRGATDPYEGQQTDALPIMGASDNRAQPWLSALFRQTCVLQCRMGATYAEMLKWNIARIALHRTPSAQRLLLYLAINQRRH